MADDLLLRRPLERMPRRDPEVLSASLGDGAVLYHRVAQQVHVLSASAAQIWDGCDGETAVADLVAVLADRHGADPAVVARDVGSTLGSFAEVHLVLGGRPAEVPPARVDLPPPDPAGVPRPEAVDLPHVGVPFTIAEVPVVVRSDDADLVRYLDLVLAPLAGGAASRTTGAAAVDVAVVLHAGPGGMWVDGELIARPTGAAGAAAMVLWHCNRLAIDLGRPRLSVHAGAVVAPSGEVVLLPAAPDSGKSTLTLGLVRAGWAYLGDEAFGIALDDGEVVAHRKPLTLDPGSWPLFPDLEPDLGDLAWMAHGKWHLDLRRVGGGVAGGDGLHLRDVGTVVLPTYRPDAPTVIEPLSPGELAVGLAGNTFNLADCGEAGLVRLAGLADGARGWRLVSGDLDAAVAAVHDVVGAGG